MAVTIDSVTTGDAAATTAPHKISNKTGKSTATVRFTPSGGAINAYMVRLGHITPYTGTLLGRQGLVCDEREPCSASLACSDYSSPSGTQIAEDITYAETGGPADGDLLVNVYVSQAGGWV